MNLPKLPLDKSALDKKHSDYKILTEAEKSRKTVSSLIDEEKYLDALERTISTMREMRDCSDYTKIEFRTVLATLLYDLAEIHFLLKDYKQSEKELDTLFKVIGKLLTENPDRYGEFHIIAMALAAKILRGRKKATELLEKEHLNAEVLLEKVKSGAVSATERLVDSLHKVGELLAASGVYKEALKFYADAIRFSKKRSGRVARKEIKLTIEMAEIMSRMRAMRPRAKRLLGAVLPHAIALETVELEEEIIALLELIEKLDDEPSKWKKLWHGISLMSRFKGRKKAEEKPAEEMAAADEPAKEEKSPKVKREKKEKKEKKEEK